MTCIHSDPKHTPGRHIPSGKGLETHDYHDLIDKLADKVEDKVIAWWHDMHQNPELPNREFRTAKLIAEHLETLNFDEVRTEVGVTGVVGLLKRSPFTLERSTKKAGSTSLATTSRSAGPSAACISK